MTVRSSKKFEFLGMVILYRFDPFFGPNAPRWTLGVPHRDLVPWPLIRFFSQIDDRGVVKIRILGHGNFLRFWPNFWPQWDPIGPKMDPRGSPPWIGAITVNSIFCPNRWPRSSQKFEFWGMVIFYGFDPFFGPNGTPLTSRWTLGGPHRDLAP